MVRSSLFASLLATTLAVGSNAKSRKAKAVLPGAFIFELEDGHDANAFGASLSDHGTTRMELTSEVFNGISIQLHDPKTAAERVEKLAALPQVKAVHPVELYAMPNPTIEWIAGNGDDAQQQRLLSARAEGGPDTFSPHVMTQVDKLRAKGITGQGIRIAVVDTGIDYLHPALGGCYGKDCLVSFGHDFVGDAYTGRNTPHPGGDPMDCAGHGTHVAGIIAAQNNTFGFTGSALGATLGAYRVFGCHGFAGTDVLIAAFNKAYQDGAHIITSSVGDENGWGENPWDVVISRIVDKGVACVLAAGNSGDDGIFRPGGAADGHGIGSIASFDNVQTPMLFYSSQYQIDNGPEQTFGYATSPINHWDGVTLPVWARTLDTTVTNDACDPFPADTPDLSKYITLIHRGNCSYVQKITNAVAKGAKNIIIYNYEVTTVDMDVGALPAGRLNSLSMVNNVTGAIFINALKDGKKLTLKMTASDKAQRIYNVMNNTASGGAVSSYSSWGPTWEMDTKPQFGAVGGNVLSTWPRAKGSYAVLSGTSMACPQAAAIIALIRQVRGPMKPSAILDLLSSNANPQLFNDKVKFYDFFAPVPQQGGGLVQAHDAAFAKTLLSPSSLSFNDTDHFAKSLNFTLQNTDMKPVTYKISHAPAIAMYAFSHDSRYVQPFPNEPVAASATLQFSETSVTLRGGQAKTITVSAVPPAGLDAKRLPVWSGYIAVNGTDGTSLSLPYQGLTGSLRQQTVLYPEDTYFSLSTDRNNVPAPVPSNTTFVLPGPGNAGVNDTLPVVTINLALGSRKIRADIVPLTPEPNHDMNITEFWGVKTIGQPYGFPAEWNSRGIGKAAWDGRLDSGSYAPPGTYKMVIRALRIFGDERKQDQWDVSTTPVLSIKYR
ncbi:hypothetical protein E4U43_007326 [Claviceps pusilla]|uniref:Subtilisin-like serine protease n=1 Tax=Claviceps pusilla TaxID=123648 RepID=A0A9P7NCZ8_9HYPO|nr:hypothetical protein E4U43_007326 [Claviceps pusilla]